MKLTKLAFVAAASMLAACNGGTSSSVKIDPTSSDETKFSYMLGTQFEMQLDNLTKNQLEFTVETAEFESGISDGNKMLLDTAFKVKYSDSMMNAIGSKMQERARAIYMAKAPMPKRDSADTTPAPKAPEKPGPMDAKLVTDASYLLGVQFGAQLASLSKQFDVTLDVATFKQGIWDMQKTLADTTQKLQLPKDSLDSVGQRFRQKMIDAREAAMKKAQAEQDSLKKALEPLRGDTLSDGTQAKMNFAVQATGITVSAEDFKAYEGKPTLMFYFSTTCGHCRHATPEVAEIVKEFKPQGISALAVATGSNNKRSVREFIEEFKLDSAGIDVFFDEKHQFGEIYSDGYVPKVYIVKPDGSLMTFKSFESQRDSIKAELAKLVPAKAESK